jgi:polysaccharide export outer membrane protein
MCLVTVLSLLGHAQPRDYLVGARDILLVTVFGQSELTGKFEVGADGSLTLPWIGRIKVGGLTTRDVEQALLAKLSPAFLRNPQITVSVDTYRSQQFSVLGEVNAPGQFYLTGETTLIQAISRAGSAKANAGDEVLIVRPSVRATSGPIRPDQVDEKDLRRVSLGKLTSGDFGANIAIEDGDTIVVQPAETVFIMGQVRNSGPYRYSRTLTVQQLLAMAGGATDRGATNRIRIVRVVNGKKQEIKASLNDKVLPNDTIVVPEKFF